MNCLEKNSLARLANDARFTDRFESIGNRFASTCRASVRTRGFTLIELLVTLAIAAILLTVVAPSLRTFVHGNELIGATNDFVGHLALVRSEALKRRINTVVCKSGGGATCVSTGTWDTGWIMFADVDSSGTWTAGDMLFRTYTPAKGSTTLAASGDKIVFDRQGKIGASSSFTFCNAIINKGRTISINQFGRHTVTPAGC